MRSLLTVFLSILVAGICVAADSGPEKYITPADSIRLSAKKASPQKAGGQAVRFIAGKDQLVAVHAGGEVIVWNLADRTAAWRKVVDDTGVEYLGVSPDGSLVFVAGRRGVLQILKTSDGTEVSKREIVKPGESYRFTTSDAAPLVAYAGGYRRTDLTWQFYENKADFEFTDQGSDKKKDSAMGTGLAASADGKRVALTNAFAKDGYIKGYTLDVYDTTTSEQVLSYERREDLYKIAFAPDNQKIAFWSSAIDPRVLLLDLKTKKETELHPDIKYVNKVVFSRDGKQVITSGPRGKEDGKPSFYIRVFDVDTAKYAAVIAPRALQPGLDKNVGVADFDTSADGKKMALAIVDGEGTAALPDILVFDLN